jgi:hypothetical protein
MLNDVKLNQGLLFKNKFKKAENQPDLKGDVYLDRSLVEQLLKDSKDNFIKVSLGAYIKKAKDESQYLSIYISKPYIPTNVLPKEEDIIPF